MSVSLASLNRDAVVRAPRIITLGVEKIGKTSFACGCRFEDGKLVEQGINSPVIASVHGEEGADGLAVSKFPTCRSYSDVLDTIGALYNEKHDFSTYVLDSASALEPLIWASICEQHAVASIEEVGGGYGKGYIEALSKWRGLLDGLDALRERNIASVIIGHVKVRRFDDPAGDSYDTYTFDLNEKAANLLFRWADVILFCNTKVLVKKEDKGFGQEKKRGIELAQGSRFLYTQKKPAHPGGGRGVYGRLPYELPLDWSAFEKAVEAAAKQ
jgi:hypothetical protein